jgi:hypothetical protein
LAAFIVINFLNITREAGSSVANRYRVNYYKYRNQYMVCMVRRICSVYTRLVIGTSRTIGSAKKFVRITSGFGGGEFT